MTTDDNQAIRRFQEYLRIKSVHPNPDYESCIKWIQTQASEIGLEFNVVHFQPPPGFAVWLTWKGTESGLSSVMFNSHMDVVPVDISKWTKDPFAALKDASGKIFARGSQDMKSVGVQHLEAVRKLKANGFVPKRSIHISFVPDEEIGGTNGMAKFVETEEFKKLNVGFELDESGPCPTEQFILTYAERALWQIKITITGDTGHALSFVENTCAEKLQKLINGFLQVREEEKAKLKGSLDGSKLGEVTTLNITMINGGLQPNVIPPEITVVVDIRVSPNGWTEATAEEMIDKIVLASGPGITYEFINKNPLLPETRMDNSNPWWTCFQKACEQIKIQLLPIICPGATDARFLRNKGIPAFGFSPINHSPMLLHNNDEYLEEHIFLKGIDIFVKMMSDLANFE